MFLFKALFIRLYTLLAPMIAIYSLWQLSQGQWRWLAPLLAWAPLWLINLWRYYRANVFFLDERESAAMLLALVGVGIVWVAGERDPVLWLTLAGLFSLLLYVYLMSSLSRGVREALGEKEALADVPFRAAAGSLVTLRESTQVQLVVFMHSHWSAYSRMWARELMEVLEQHNRALSSGQVAVVFCGSLPSWSDGLVERGVHCWVDPDGQSCERLGLWLRGGSRFFSGAQHALRPAYAVLNAQRQSILWEQAENFRLPPSLQHGWGKITRALQR